MRWGYSSLTTEFRYVAHVGLEIQLLNANFFHLTYKVGCTAKEKKSGLRYLIYYGQQLFFFLFNTKDSQLIQIISSKNLKQFNRQN